MILVINIFTEFTNLSINNVYGRIKETYGKRCRGSDCHEGYFFRDYLSYSLY